ncbi:hypothetical protein IV203_027915 [Nitzschia inconspicua]|uniref:PiggyBac transposable element-derived protein domain-containing protein n=1 Tax=Nitzschia inconspicua TaxID=303405 RepID=A0A9K3Q6I1_9STRA|nr:hypothetical protein IV203_027915 [Nitzschia inconspicua]
MATPTPTAVDNVPPSAESADTFQSAEQHELEPTVAYEATPIQMRQLFPNPHLPMLPLYLRHFVDRTAVPLSLNDVEEENEDEGIDGVDDDSVEDAFEASVLTEAVLQRDRDLVGNEDDDVQFTDANAIRGLDPDAVDLEEKIPKPPDDWSPPALKQDKNERPFETVDNPGGWDRYYFVPRFDKKTGLYQHHSTPTKCRPCPPDPERDGLRTCNGWVFYYQDWKLADSWKPSSFSFLPEDAPVPVYRIGSTPSDPLPSSRKGCLNYNLLRRMGLSKKRLEQHDPLFFLQLLLPICRPDASDIEQDPRLPYYSNVMTWSQSYATKLGLGGSYGHRFKEVMIPELVRFDGALIRDGLLGGATDGAIYRRWKPDDAGYDQYIGASLTHTRFLQLKRVWKLNDNEQANKRGEEGYDPAYKYDYIFNAIIHNVRAISERASLDLCGDETTWGHQGYREKGSGVLERIMNKPGITKGMQTVLLCDAYRFRVYAYHHRHKMHKGWPEWSKKQGPTEVRSLMETISAYVDGGTALPVLWTSKPHTTWDNHFSGDEVMNWLGTNGYSATMTCRRDRLPSDIPRHFLHHEKTDPGSKPAKCARFSQPVTAVKVYEIDASDANDNKKYYTRVHVSMQSTSSTNFSTVNAMNENKKWIAKKDRGRAINQTKRVWGIEMNTARQLYLKTYGQIDTVDSMLRRCRIYNKSFKYWHSSKNHALAMAVVMAYDMYLECTTETPCHEFFQLDDTTRLKLSKGPLKFHEFKDKLSIQMLTYAPANVFYPGDRNFREVTEMSIEKRNARKRRATTESMPTATTSMLNDDQFAMMMKKKKAVTSRFCGDLSKYKQHLASKETTNTRNNCFVCGEKTRTRCGMCSVALHGHVDQGTVKGRSCYMDYHDECMFGLCRSDAAYFGRKKNQWSMPTDRERKSSIDHYRRMVSGAPPTRSRTVPPPSAGSLSSLTQTTGSVGASAATTSTRISTGRSLPTRSNAAFSSDST